MNVLFHLYVPGALRSAGTLQSFRVCYFLARAGADVHLHICTHLGEAEDAGGSGDADGDDRTGRAADDGGDERTAGNRGRLFAFFGLPEEPRLHVTLHRQPFRESAPNGVRKAWGMLFHLKRILTLLVTAERKQYDVFLARGYRFPALHIFFRTRLGYRVVFEMHELNVYHDAVDADLDERASSRDVEGYIFRNADGVAPLSRSLLEIARRRFGEPRAARVIPSGAEPFSGRPIPEGRAPRHVYFVGNVYPLSGVEHAIEAVADLRQATLTVVGTRGPGDENHDRLATRIAELGAQDRITLRRFVDPARLPDVYAEADILVAPYVHTLRTAYFASPLKVFEYMHARRPIVASDLPTIREVLMDGENALLVPPADAAALRDALRRLMNEPALGRELAERAHADGKRYTLEEKCRTLHAFLTEVTAGGAP